MKSKLKRFYQRAAVMLLMMLLMMTAQTAWAADITQNTAVVINSSNKSTYEGKTITGTVPSSSYTGQHGNFISQGAIVVDGIELNLTIDGFTADYSAFNTSATTRASGISLVNGATLHLTLKGTNTLTGGYGGAGIAVPDGCTLEITAASTGSLTATGGDEMGGGAGIGSIGNSNKTNQGSNMIFPQGCGTITINGGTITAQGGTWHQQYTPAGGAAGIGSSEESGVSTSASYGSTAYINNVTGSITISSGTINATGGASAAGIGGGNAGTVQTISIKGGQVTATRGSDNAAAIGTGYNGFTSGNGTLTCPLIIIEQGTVQANGNIGFGNAYVASNNVGDSYAFIGEANVTCTGTMNEPKMPEVKNSKTFSIPDGVRAFKVYDPAGKNAEYSTQEKGTSTLTLTAPTGYRLQVTGTVKAVGTFKVYDGTSESTQLAIVSNDMSGTPVSTASSGQSLRLKYTTPSNSFGNATYRSDYELLVTVFKAGEKKSVSIQQTDGGTVTSDTQTAEYGETVTLTVTPNAGKFVEKVVFNDGSDHTVDRSDDGKYRFAMPVNDVTARAQFEDVSNLNFGTITGLKGVYLYEGGNAIEISYGVEAVDGTLLSNGTEYDAVITNSSNTVVASVTAIGTYTLTVTGKGSYTGSLTQTFVVQEGLRGSGSREAPYLIGSTDEWDIFVRKVNSGVTFVDQYIDLERDITVTQGTSFEKYFQGTFNGNSHTITMNNVSGKGLFGKTGHNSSTAWNNNTITIKNLTVAGSITDSGGDYCAAVVGCFGGGKAPCALENIIVTASITAASTSVGGIVGKTTGNCTNSISNCVFAGSINGGTHAAGMVGSYQIQSGNSVTITNCLEVGTYTNVTNFHPMAAVEDSKVTVTKGYYVHPKSGSPNGNCTQGTQVFTITTDGYCDISATAATSYGGTDYFTAGTEVTLSHNDREGYTFTGYTVKDANDIDVNVTETSGVYSFQMPAKNVSVTAHFRKLLSHTDIAVTDIPTQTYDGTALTPQVTVTDGGSPMTLGTDYTVSYENNTNAGTATVTITGTGNYDGTTTKTFTIDKATINPTVSITGWTYGDTPNAPSVTGNPGNGAVTYQYRLNANGAPGYSDAVPTNVGYYSVKATIAETANYKDGTATATFAIAQKPVTITGLSVENKEYDGTTDATITGTATIDSKIGSDDVGVYMGSAEFEDANVGTGKTVTFSGFYLIGESVHNYTLSAQPASVTADIVPKVCVQSGGIEILKDQGKTYAVIDGNYSGSDGINLTERISVDHVTYNRTFPTNDHSSQNPSNDNSYYYNCTIMLPFEVNTSQLTGVDYIYTFSGVEKDRHDTWVVTMTKVWEYTSDPIYLTPYTPYLVRMKSSSLGISKEVTFVPTGPNNTTVGDWQFRGTYNYTIWDATHNNADLGKVYGFAASAVSEDDIEIGDFVRATAGAYIYPLRAYLYYGGSDPNWDKSSQAPHRASDLDGLPDRMPVRIIGKETTGLSPVPSPKGEGSDYWYTLDGRKVNGKPTAKGIYIHGGRKVVILNNFSALAD